MARLGRGFQIRRRKILHFELRVLGSHGGLGEEGTIRGTTVLRGQHRTKLSQAGEDCSGERGREAGFF